MNLTRIFDICIGDSWNDATKYNSLDDFGCAIENTNYLGTPIFEQQFVDIPYGATIDLSSALTGEPIFKNREIRLKLGALETSTQWTQKMSNIRNLLHGQRVCISFDDDANYFYNGRCSIENFDATRDLGTFEMVINAKPHKYSKTTSSQLFTYKRTDVPNISNTNIWRVYVTSNDVFDAEHLAIVEDYLNNPQRTVPQDILDVYDFNGNGRIDYSDYQICLEAQNYYLFSDLPQAMQTHSPFVIRRGVYKIDEKINYHLSGSLQPHTFNGDEVFPNMHRLNKRFTVSVLKKDGTKMTYDVLGDEFQIPMLYADNLDEYIGVSINLLNWYVHYNAQDVINFEIGKDSQGQPIYEQRTVISTITSVNKNIYLETTERSL